jgi:hypothetical protein
MRLPGSEELIISDGSRRRRHSRATEAARAVEAGAFWCVLEVVILLTRHRHSVGTILCTVFLVMFVGFVIWSSMKTNRQRLRGERPPPPDPNGPPRLWPDEAAFTNSLRRRRERRRRRDTAGG